MMNYVHGHLMNSETGYCVAAVVGEIGFWQVTPNTPSSQDHEPYDFSGYAPLGRAGTRRLAAILSLATRSAMVAGFLTRLVRGRAQDPTRTG